MVDGKSTEGARGTVNQMLNNGDQSGRDRCGDPKFESCGQDIEEVDADRIVMPVLIHRGARMAASDVFQDCQDRPATVADKIRQIKSAEPGIGWQVWTGSVAINLLSLALPLTILQAYDRILPNRALNTFTLMVLGVATAILLEMLMRNARVAVLGWHTAQFEFQAVMASVSRILKASAAAISQMPAGALLDKVQSIDILRSSHSGQSRLALIDLPFACLFIALMFLIGGRIGAVPVLLMRQWRL